MHCTVVSLITEVLEGYYFKGQGTFETMNGIQGYRDTKFPGFWGYLFKVLYNFRILLKILSGIRDIGDPTSRTSYISYNYYLYLNLILD